MKNNNSTPNQKRNKTRNTGKKSAESRQKRPVKPSQLGTELNKTNELHAPLFDQMNAPLPRKLTNPYRPINPNEIFFEEEQVLIPEKANRKTKNRKRRKSNQAADESTRKITHAQARRRRNRRRLAAVLVTLVVMIVGFILSVTVLFKIQGYELAGEGPYSTEDLSIAFGHIIGENMFAFNAGDAEIKMQKLLPYAETVTVRRRLPGTVVFKVVPAIETYYINVNETYLVFSGMLKLLRTDTKAPVDLMEIKGATPQSLMPGEALTIETQDKLDALKELINALATEQFAPVTSIDVTNELEINILYDNRARVILGTASDLKDKLAVAKTVLEEHIGKSEHGVLDVSHQNENEHRSGVWRAGKI